MSRRSINFRWLQLNFKQIQAYHQEEDKAIRKLYKFTINYITGFLTCQSFSSPLSDGRTGAQINVIINFAQNSTNSYSFIIKISTSFSSAMYLRDVSYSYPSFLSVHFHHSFIYYYSLYAYVSYLTVPTAPFRGGGGG